LSHKSIWAFFEDRAGNLLVSTRGGVDQFDSRTGQFTPLIWPQPASLGSNQLGQLGQLGQAGRPRAGMIKEDSEGQLWFTSDGTLVRLVRSPGGAVQAKYFPARRGVSVIHITRDGMIWLGSHGNGLWRFDPATEQFTTFLHDLQNPHSLSNNLI